MKPQFTFEIRFFDSVSKNSIAMIRLKQMLWSDNWSLVPEELRYTDSREKFNNKIRRWKPNDSPRRICKNYIANVRFPEIFENYFKYKLIFSV